MARPTSQSVLVQQAKLESRRSRKPVTITLNEQGDQPETLTFRAGVLVDYERRVPSLAPWEQQGPGEERS